MLHSVEDYFRLSHTPSFHFDMVLKAHIAPMIKQLLYKGMEDITFSTRMVGRYLLVNLSISLEREGEAFFGTRSSVISHWSLVTGHWSFDQKTMRRARFRDFSLAYSCRFDDSFD